MPKLLKPGDIVLDYQGHTGRPTIPQLLDMGVDGVIRYVTGRPWDTINPRENKDLFPAELEQLVKAGIGVIPNHELSAKTPHNAPASKGQQIAEAFEQANHDLGITPDIPGFVSIDYDARLSDVDDYITGWKRGCDRPSGPYGGRGIVEACHSVFGMPVAWQASAWSGFRVIVPGKPVNTAPTNIRPGGGIHPLANVFQHTIEVHRIVGGKQLDYDVNSVQRPILAFDGTTDTPKPPAEKPGHIIASELDVGARNGSIEQLQRVFNAILGARLARDGLYGPKTVAAAKAWQKAHGVDGNPVDGDMGYRETVKAVVQAKLPITVVER